MWCSVTKQATKQATVWHSTCRTSGSYYVALSQRVMRL